MKTIMLNAEECDIDLKALFEKIDEIEPEVDLYGFIVDEQMAEV